MPIHSKMIPSCRGKISQKRTLSNLTWLRVGGTAEWFFQPADLDDLRDFLKKLESEIPIFVIGVGSNLIVRDCGIDGVVVRLGRPFAEIEINGCLIRAGAAALDSTVARYATKHGLDITFLRTIPGTIGGAIRMNAGCYGSYIQDVCKQITFVERSGKLQTIPGHKAEFGYRKSKIPSNAVIVEAIFECPEGDPIELESKMALQIVNRNKVQPIQERSAGSTFRNPSGFSSTGKIDDCHEFKAWRLIDKAGLRGYRHGQAAVSEQHPNFLINLGGASALEFETLGELIQKKVFENSGIMLEWELVRIGRKSRNSDPTK